MKVCNIYAGIMQKNRREGEPFPPGGKHGPACSVSEEKYQRRAPELEMERRIYEI